MDPSVSDALSELGRLREHESESAQLILRSLGFLLESQYVDIEGRARLSRTYGFIVYPWTFEVILSPDEIDKVVDALVSSVTVVPDAGSAIHAIRKIDFSRLERAVGMLVCIDKEWADLEAAELVWAIADLRWLWREFGGKVLFSERALSLLQKCALSRREPQASEASGLLDWIDRHKGS